jgi:hypothetical protein
MASGQRSTWPIVLLLGLCVSLLVGSAVAFATPSEDGGSWWHDDGAQRITGTVLEVDRTEGTVVLDELITYEPQQDEIGTLTVAVADLGEVRPGDTVDVDLVRHDGRWSAAELILLDTD